MTPETTDEVDGSPAMDSVRTYQKVNQEVYKLVFDADNQIYEVDTGKLKDLADRDSAPDELSDFVLFLLENLRGLANGDRDALEELREKIVSLYQRIRDDLDTEFWSLMDEGYETESLIAIHDLFDRIMEEQIALLDEADFYRGSLRVEEGRMGLILESTAFLSSKLLLLMDEGELDGSQKEELREQLIELEDKTDHVPEEEQYERLETAII